MGALANAFALLADQQGKDASTIVALKSTEVKKIAEKKKKIAEEKKKAEAKKKIAEEKKKAEAMKKIAEEKKKAEAEKKKSSLRDARGRGKEGHDHGEKSLDGNAVDNGHQHDVRSDSTGRADGPAYTSNSNAKGNTGDRQANQEHKAVNHHDNENQGKVSGRTLLLSKEELAARWLAREKERKEEEAKREEQWLAREAERRERWHAREAELAKKAERKARSLAREAEREERRLAREEERKREIEEKRKKEMAMKTLQEYEELKAYEKQKTEKVTLSVPETPMREAAIYKNEIVNKDSNIKKYGKVHKTMSIDEFLKLPTEREIQDGPGKGNQYEDNTVKVKEGPPPDLSETSFPVLSKVTKPSKFY